MKFKWLALFLLLSLALTLPSPSVTQTREPAKVYKVAILPFLIHSQENLDYLREGIYDILLSRITVEGRIEVIERSLVERALYEEKPMRLDETVATKIGMRVGADYIVLGSLTKIGSYISLDARLISITEEKPPLGAYTQHKGIDDVMVKIGDFAQDIGYKILGRRPMAGRPTEPRRPSIAQQKGEIGRIGPEDLSFKKSQTFGFEIKGLDIGDVDGDKKNEVVVIDTNNVYIFKYDGEKLSLFQKIEAGYQHNFLTLDVADVNRNGYAEIIVTSVIEDNLQSFIFEYEEGKFRKITEKAGWYFRVLDHPKEGPILMGQQMGSEGIYVGPIYKFVWKKKSFEKGPKMPFPKETKIFGLTVADIRKQGTLDTIILDNSDHLRVYIPQRIIIKDLEGEGIPKVIIIKNEFATGSFFTRLRIYETGAIYNLIWDDNTLTTNWKTREIKGYIADYQIRDVDNDGDEELVVAAVAPEEDVSGLLSQKSRSNILFFKLF